MRHVESEMRIYRSSAVVTYRATCGWLHATCRHALHTKKSHNCFLDVDTQRRVVAGFDDSYSYYISIAVTVTVTFAVTVTHNHCYNSR